MPDYIFDSTVLIDYLRGSSSVRPYIEIILDQPRAAAYSIMTEAELWSGIRNRDDERRHKEAISRMTRLTITSRIARVA